MKKGAKEVLWMAWDISELYIDKSTLKKDLTNLLCRDSQHRPQQNQNDPKNK